MAVDDLADLLDDLQHDLGKHARLPLAMLPIDAPTDAVRDALVRGLQRTKAGPAGTVSAGELWQRFCQAVPESAANTEWFGHLQDHVRQALRWQDGGGSAPDRAAAEADLQALAGAIRQARREVADDR